MASNMGWPPATGRRRLGRQAVWLFLLLLPACTSADDVFVGECVGVIDGDTISVLRQGLEVRIRLEGIDCPERNQAFYQSAKKFTSAAILGRDVTVRVATTDRYGRLVARVAASGLDLSAELVRQGLAKHYKKYSDDPVLAALDRDAQGARIGLWSDTSRHYRGNRRSRVFHSPQCEHANCRNCSRRFATREEALEAGFKPCGICKP